MEQIDVESSENSGIVALRRMSSSSLEDFFAQKTIDIVIPFFNESGNILAAHQNSIKLEKLFQIKNYIYVNNGSVDNTLEELEGLKEERANIKIVDVKENIGYGNGFKKGFEVSFADFVMTNHADQQFDAYQFYLSIIDDLNTFDKNYSIFPIRKGRPVPAAFFTMVLRQVLSMILGVRLKDFNGQPKLIDKSALLFPIHTFPNDFSFDLMLFKSIRFKRFYPILENKREVGESSWNTGMSAKYRLFKSYIKSARNIKKLRG